MSTGVELSRPQATHVDRLFGFVEETRRRCTHCQGPVQAWYSSQRVLRVSPFASRGGPCTVTEMYLAGCAGQEEGLRCPQCQRQMMTQRRMHSAANVLVVQVRHLPGVSRVPVAAEEQLELPGLPAMELVGVVYHNGATFDSGHYTCLCRGPGGRFWFYDDDKPAVRVTDEVAHLKTRQVYMLVYCRQDGSASWSAASSGEGLVNMGKSEQL